MLLKFLGNFRYLLIQCSGLPAIISFVYSVAFGLSTHVLIYYVLATAVSGANVNFPEDST